MILNHNCQLMLTSVFVCCVLEERWLNPGTHPNFKRDPWVGDRTAVAIILETLLWMLEVVHLFCLYMHGID